METILRPYMEGLTIRKVGEAELGQLYDLECSNNAYNRLCMGHDITWEETVRETTDVPDSFDPARKHFLGFWDGERLAAVADLLVGYPRDGVWFIGLLMVDGRLHGQGYGRRIVRGIAEAAKGRADALRLGVVAENAAGLAFWQAMGFAEIYRTQVPSGEKVNEVVVMERFVPDDVATPDDIVAIEAAAEDLRAGHTMGHDAIDWD